MVAIISRLKSFANLRAARQPHQDSTASSAVQQAPSSRTTGRHSISPKLRTFFEPLSPSKTAPLGVLESPTTSPESAYSGVAILGDVEIVRRVSKGRVKRIELSKVERKYESVSVGTQTEDANGGKPAAELVMNVLSRSSGAGRDAWEMLHSGDAGLLFMASAGAQEGERQGREQQQGIGKAALPLTGNLLRKLQQAIAGDAELQACQKRTTREIATLNCYQENLRKRKELLKEQLQQLKAKPGSELDEEKLAVDKELVRVWEASIETMDQRLKCDERLEKKREAFERVARAALAVLALGLAERMLLDVDEGEGGRPVSEVEFEGKYWLGG